MVKCSIEFKEQTLLLSDKIGVKKISEQLKIRYPPRMAYSKDLRLRVIAYVESGHTMAQVVSVFKVHIGTVIAWCKRYRTTGNIERKVRRSVNKKSIPKNSLICRSAPRCQPQRNHGCIRLLPVIGAETAAQTRHHAKKRTLSTKSKIRKSSGVSREN